MKKRILSWGLILSLFVSLLPVSVMATEGELAGDGLLVTGGTQCTCGAEPDAQGIVTHAEGCPLVAQEEPALETGEPTTGTEEPAAGMQEPTTGTEKPTPGTEQPAHETERPVFETLTPPVLTCVPLDEENSSDMVLTVEGEWDSYAWESCSYGSWSDWSGDGPSLTLSKEDFTAYGFRCTVTLGERSVTSETFAYDPSMLERPMQMANGLSDDSLSGSSGYIRYYEVGRYGRFDIHGMDDGTAFKTTFANSGYRTAISVNGGSKVGIPYQSGAVSVGSSLTAQTELDIVYGGRYVKVTYTVTNSGSATQNFQIGSSADVMIDNNDRAKVEGVFSGGRCTGLSMDGAPKNDYEFQLVAPDCVTLWYGFYSKAYSNIFNDLPDKSTPYSGDSGMAWSWNGDVAPGQTWSRYVLIGAGELPEAPNPPTLTIGTNPAWLAGDTVTVTGTATGPDTVCVNFGGEEYEAPVQSDGSFSVEIAVPENTPAGPNSFTYWGTTDDGGISEIQSHVVTIVAKPFIELTTNGVTVTEGETGLNEAWLRNFIKSHSGNVTIQPNSIDTNKPGEQLVTYTASTKDFESATAVLAVTVLPQPAALTQTTVTRTGEDFTLTATMTYTGGLTYIETGFVYGALQNPTLPLNDGRATTDPPVSSKGGEITATINGDKLAYGVNYYVRAYAKTADGTVIYGDQSVSFGIGAANYGTFSVVNNGNSTFTITRANGDDGEQTVYYRTVNGSAIGGTHFVHVAGSVTFAAGQVSKTITVEEKDVTSTYNGNAATAYSNTDRTYSFEIYRVVGGANIENRTATRTMNKDNSYMVDRTVYDEKERTVSTSDDNNYVADQSGSDSTDHKIYFQNNRGRNISHGQYNFHVTRALDVGTANQQQYLKSTADGFLYRASFSFEEEKDGYQHVWIANHEPNNITSNTIYDGAIDLNDSSFGAAIYTGRWETAGSGDLNLPSETGNRTAIVSNVAEGKKVGDRLLFGINDTAQVWFSATGKNEDIWYMTQYTDYLRIYDTREPQLLGVAPMAGGSYLPGNSVTVALVFDEIVDSQNSTLDNVSIVTNWGTFNYSGGANTNVLYFTGTIKADASGTLKVTSITNAENIKDMTNDTGTTTGGTVSNGQTSASLGTEGVNVPMVTVGTITNNSGTLTAAVSCSPSVDVKLEYVWSDSPDVPTTGWRLVTSGSTVSIRETSGTWYLYARATNSDGVTDYDSQSFTFQGGSTVELPSLTVTVNNAEWVQSRPIAVAYSPAGAKVTVKTPGGSSAIVSHDTYTAITNGTYTFTLENGDETITRMVTVSKIDTTVPTVEVMDLTNTSHIEAVTLTVRASDGESGMRSMTGTWSNSDGSSQPATFSGGENGVYTTTSPNAGGTWTLSVAAMDNAGNAASSISSAYTVNLSSPTVTVTEQTSGSGRGVTYNYTIAAGGSEIVSVQLPEGCALPDGTSLPTQETIMGTVTLTTPGTHYIIVTDATGHVVESAAMVVEESEAVDTTPPEVRLSAASNGAATLTINVSVFEEGGTVPSVTVEGPTTPTISLTPDSDGVYTGAFAVTAAGIYTATAIDGTDNEGTTSITVYSATFGGEGVLIPAQLVVSGDKATEPAAPTRTGYTFAGWYNGDMAYSFDTAVETDLTLIARWTALEATAPVVTAGSNLTQPYGTSGGTISVIATAADDATYALGYQWYSNTASSTSGGTKISGETGSSYTIPVDTAAGIYYFYCVVTATRTDNGQETTATSGVITVTINKAAQDPPDAGVGYRINFQSETITIETGYEVFDAQDNGTEIESGAPITPGDIVYIRRQGSNTHEPSGWTAIEIPPRPAAPMGITKTDETIKNKKDGTVSGITAVMEYHTGDGQWKPGTDTPLTGLPAGTTVTVRYPASQTAFASVQTQVTIGASTRTLTVIFDENGGTDVEDATGLSYGDQVAAPAISRTGYTLDGWYNGETKWDFEKDDITDDLTLIAHWSLSTYTITYNLNGGSFADGTSNPASYTMETETFSLSNPSKLGYTFAGWTEGDETTLQPTITISKGTTGNKVYTAHWVIDRFTVTLSPSKTEVTYGEEIIITAVPSHGATDVTYTYQWYRDDSTTPITGANDSTLTLTDVSDSGRYQVKVTASDGSQDQTASSNDVAVTVQKKPIFVTWSGLYQTYDDTETEVTATPSGVLDGDVVSALVSGEGQTAGNHNLTATLTGADTNNYALQNSTATLTIQPKPVIFTVANNAVQADGKPKSAAVMSEDVACTYTASYRQNDKEVGAPVDAGEYEIWVKITDANYRHTNGGDTMQVGTLTITQAEPVVYTASFTGGEGVTGSGPVPQTAVADGQITLPANPFSKTVGTTRYRFTGWKTDGDSRLYRSGDVYVMPARDVTFTAQWEAVFTVSGGIIEKNPDGTPGEAVGGAVVSLWLGANKIDETTTGSNGTYHFDNLIPGTYNLVVTKGVRTVTRMVSIADADQEQNASLPAFVTNSIVEVAPGSPDIVVGQLDQAFTDDDQETAQNGGKVELTFTAEEKQPDEVTDDLAKIDEKVPSSVNLALAMDYAITKTVTTVSSEGVESTTTESISQAHALLEILLPLPTRLQDKYSYSVYRVHSSTGSDADKVAQELKEGEVNRNELGEYFTVSSDKTGITLYVKCFSTYAIGYSDAPVTPTPPDGNSGGSGGSYPSTYPPKVEQPEHGSVTISPKNPSKGDKVTITPTPENGYTVDKVTVTDSKGQTVEIVSNDDGTYTFIQPTGKVTITVTFRQMINTSDCPRNDTCPLTDFSDTDRKAWYHDGIHYCLEKGLMVGISKTTFAPYGVTTRGMIAAILWRMEGSPIVDGSMDYNDVKLEDWYGEAVCWADSESIVTGYGNGKFGSADPITREQMATMLWRYAGSPDVDGSLSTFVDGAQTSDWAQSAMIWAVDQGLIAGVDNNRLDPWGQATRAQVATILMRFTPNMAQ